MAATVESTNADDDIRRNQRVLAWRIRMLYENAPVGLVVSLVVSFCVAIFIFLEQGIGSVWVWWLAMLSLMVVRAVGCQRFLRRARDDVEVMDWLTPFHAGAAATGILWGTVCLLDLSNPLFVTTLAIVCGMAAVALPFLAHVFKIYLSYMLGATLPGLGVLLWSGNHMLALPVFIFILGMVYAGRLMSEFVLRTRAMSIDKQQLAERLANANESLMRDIAARERAEQLLELERAVLEKVATHVPLDKVCGEVVETLQSAIPGVRGAVVLWKPGSSQPLLVQAPNLPEGFSDLVMTLPMVRACGGKGAITEPKVVKGIDTKPGWQGLAKLTTSFNPPLNTACLRSLGIQTKGTEGVLALFGSHAPGQMPVWFDVTHRFACIIDIAIERAQIENDLKRSEQRFKGFTDIAADWGWEMDADGRYSFVSGDVSNIMGIPAHRILGKTQKELFSLLSVQIDNEKQRILDDIEACENFEIEYDFTGPEGKRVVVRSVAHALYDDGRFHGYRGITRDVTPDAILTEKISRQASTDPLTEVYNRRAFDEFMKRVVERSDPGYYFCFVDLDRLKLINDRYGHDAGDRVLREVSGALVSVFDEHASVGRLGGDEFGVLFKCPDDELAKQKCNDIVESIYDVPFNRGRDGFRLTASIGLVPVPESLEMTSDVFRTADYACYNAKTLGGNRWVYLNQVDEIGQRTGISGASKLVESIERDKLALYTQPIFHIGSTVLNEGMSDWWELLIRLPDATGARQSPIRFIDACERYGLMGDVDCWVLEKGIELWRELNDDRSVRLSVNISASSVARVGTLTAIKQLLEKHAIPPDSVCLEFTCDAEIEDLRTTRNLLQEIRNLGCSLALDDFGGGASSMLYLREFPVDFVKLDGNLVTRMLEHPRSRHIVENINDLAHRLGIRTVAEWVENPETLDVLLELKVDFAQGYHLGPVTALDSPLEFPQSAANS